MGREANGERDTYLLDLTKAYHNLLSINGKNKNQTFYWDNNVTAMEEGEDGLQELHYYLQDELGSPLRVSTTDGYLTYGYDEFGNDLGRELEKAGIPNPYVGQGEGQPFGYTGYRYDDISSTYFAQAREYQPKSGRFTAEDVIKGNGAVPITLNQYGYCWGNPLTMVDLNGKNPEEGDYYVYYLNNAEGAKIFGHNAILIVNKDGTSDFYSYMGTGGIPNSICNKDSLGYMGHEELNAEKTEAFLETGSISIIMADETPNEDDYDRALRRSITKEEYEELKKEADKYVEIYEEGAKLGENNAKYLEETDGAAYNLYKHNCDTVVGNIISEIDPYFNLCQENMISTTPNNSYYVRKELLDDTWDEVGIGNNELTEKLLSEPGMYYIAYVIGKEVSACGIE